MKCTEQGHRPTRGSLQHALKELRASGTVLSCKLNAPTTRLQLEYDRLTATPEQSLAICQRDLNEFEPSVNRYEGMAYLPSRGLFPAHELLACTLPVQTQPARHKPTSPVLPAHVTYLLALTEGTYTLGYRVGTVWYHERTQEWLGLLVGLFTCLGVLAAKVVSMAITGWGVVYSKWQTSRPYYCATHRAHRDPLVSWPKRVTTQDVWKKCIAEDGLITFIPRAVCRVVTQVREATERVGNSPPVTYFLLHLHSYQRPWKSFCWPSVTSLVRRLARTDNNITQEDT